jgi:hypothetical protein
MPQGDDVRQLVEVEGFFFKLWSYSSRFTAGEGPTADPSRRQISPLLIAPTVRLVETPYAGSPWPGRLMAGMIGGIVLATLVARFWYARRDRPFRQWRKARERDVVIEPPAPPLEAPEA